MTTKPQDQRDSEVQKILASYTDDNVFKSRADLDLSIKICDEKCAQVPGFVELGEHHYGGHMRMFARLLDALARPAPEALPDYKKRFETMVYMIGEISQALGISDDDASCANGSDLILEAIKQLHADARNMVEGVASDRCRYLLAALVDIHDDAWHHSPEHRTYEEGAFKATLDEARELLAAPAAPAPKCATCNDNGMIGGPSYYAPDEGGEPCPDCAAPAPAAQAELDGDAIFAAMYARDPYWDAQGRSSAAAVRLALDCIRQQSATPADAASEADKIDYSLARGDTVYSPYWGDGARPVEVVDVNWALRAAAVRLAPKGGIVVWPVSHLQRERQQGAE